MGYWNHVVNHLFPDAESWEEDWGKRTLAIALKANQGLRLSKDTIPKLLDAFRAKRVDVRATAGSGISTNIVLVIIDAGFPERPLKPEEGTTSDP